MHGLVKVLQANSYAYNGFCPPELHPEEGHNINKHQINFTPCLVRLTRQVLQELDCKLLGAEMVLSVSPVEH